MKRRIFEYYGGTCGDCGLKNDHVSFFDLHHIIPESKDIRVGNLLSWSWERVLAELNKCDYLCPSCHRIRHINMGDYSDMEFYETEVDSLR